MNLTEYNESVRLYADRVFRFVVKTMRHTTDAQDIVQNSFTILWQKREEVSPDKAKAFLFTVAYRQAIDYIRRNKNMSYTDELPDDGRFAPDAVAQRELQTQLHNALHHLTEVQRSAVLLRDYEGYAYHEIGEMLELTESQVKVYIFRARQKLQVLLKDVRY